MRCGAPVNHSLPLPFIFVCLFFFSFLPGSRKMSNWCWLFLGGYYFTERKQCGAKWPLFRCFSGPLYSERRLFLSSFVLLIPFPFFTTPKIWKLNISNPITDCNHLTSWIHWKLPISPLKQGIWRLGAPVEPRQLRFSNILWFLMIASLPAEAIRV